LSKRCREPERTCVGCRTPRPRAELIRFVLSPQQQLLVDYRHKLPGRGVYTCCDTACLAQAVERRQLQRGLKCPDLQVDAAGLNLAIVEVLRQRIESLLGMARKSGQVVSGSQAVLGALRAEKVLAFILISEDISAPIADKVKQAAGGRQVELLQLFDKDRIGGILGKGERSVAALQAGQLADAILFEAQRFKRMSREN